MNVRLASGAAVAAAALSVTANAIGGSPGPMLRGDDGTTHSDVSADSAALVVHGRSWSLGGGPFRAHQRLTLVRGSTLAVIGGAVVENAGKRVTIRRVGGSTFVTFATAGVYRFSARSLTVDVRVRA